MPATTSYLAMAGLLAVLSRDALAHPRHPRHLGYRNTGRAESVSTAAGALSERAPGRW